MSGDLLEVDRVPGVGSFCAQEMRRMGCHTRGRRLVDIANESLLESDADIHKVGRVFDAIANYEFELWAAYGDLRQYDHAFTRANKMSLMRCMSDGIEPESLVVEEAAAGVFVLAQYAGDLMIPTGLGESLKDNDVRQSCIDLVVDIGDRCFGKIDVAVMTRHDIHKKLSFLSNHTSQPQYTRYNQDPLFVQNLADDRQVVDVSLYELLKLKLNIAGGGTCGALLDQWVASVSGDDAEAKRLYERVNPAVLLRNFMAVHFTASVIKYVEQCEGFLVDVQKHREVAANHRTTVAGIGLIALGQDRLFGGDEGLAAYNLGL